VEAVKASSNTSFSVIEEKINFVISKQFILEYAGEINRHFS
jgi:hypothetical protein